ncbi:uncharacterized protein SPPG_06283 [Spizellomyces punctatus DAOM BR117]|uniref:Uncharacterized protein n=1 Tax=Spizellomyces punctatus (strain DAOM BR117) TaxID=645134 RepID=A0A0L0HAM7_SPIPD|nr:hypothetical protein, variant 2 [Spizellomyces punctatus DAOM BR117]XP_016606640.1 hypothetical protein, variant 1 [Spizellomyces punctatus DAOM BR117]XP_016606641.1 uncharacterized protein SPPG_06283 [Spizellomyces punctatus DAOM BR117]KNC98599.1 hypothetical protein, variant 2 [Spizellomyces punctatus DAOM BR117]KNC98600.1 hypothetical protein, variant 1 [Spizellomyces punctatus DAOM BR117]KNC98601.1 hypothetical protein SPPG_06283 [Spizellomyces punctatus DAOM BR117]|eukprot:XP_016606639.1 hypothetical protein, variant 2 [Spizellomyces punctatus DAOM BR117]
MSSDATLSLHPAPRATRRSMGQSDSTAGTKRKAPVEDTSDTALAHRVANAAQLHYVQPPTTELMEAGLPNGQNGTIPSDNLNIGVTSKTTRRKTKRQRVSEPVDNLSESPTPQTPKSHISPKSGLPAEHEPADIEPINGKFSVPTSPEPILTTTIPQINNSHPSPPDVERSKDHGRSAAQTSDMEPSNDDSFLPSSPTLPTPYRASTRATAGRTARKTQIPPSHEHNTRRRAKVTTAPTSSERIAAPVSRQLPFANGGSVINLKTKAPLTNGPQPRAAGAEDDAINDVMLFDDEIRADDDEDTVKKKLLVKAAKEEMVRIGQDYAKLRDRRIQLELDAIELEQEQIRKGTHLCYAELDAKYKGIEKVNMNRQRMQREYAHVQYEAAVKQANDTFIDRRGDTRRKMIDSINAKKWKMVAEKLRNDEQELWAFEPTPAETFVRKRQIEIDQLKRSTTGIPPYAAKYPSPIKRKLQENKRRGGRVIVPPRLCEGLQKSEIDMDLDIIRAYQQAGPSASVDQ